MAGEKSTQLAEGSETIVYFFYFFKFTWTCCVVDRALASQTRDAGVETLGKFLHTNCLC